MHIRFLEQKDIDYSRWDRCVSDSINGDIFGYSWYLDSITEHWGALIEGDYNAIMPLVYTPRFTFREIITHPLLKHTGIYSTAPVNQEKIYQFLALLPNNFKKANICFNRQNTQAISSELGQLTSDVYELDLIIPYDRLKKKYPQDVNELIAHAHRNQITLMKQPSLSEIFKFLEANNKMVPRKNFIDPLHRILARLLSKSKAEIVGIYGPENSMYGFASFVRSNSNVSLLYAYSLPEKAKLGINHMLLDRFLRNYSGRNVTLSFEHNDSSWSNQFYQSFGAIRSYKYSWKQNTLPALLRWVF